VAFGVLGSVLLLLGLLPPIISVPLLGGMSYAEFFWRGAQAAAQQGDDTGQALGLGPLFGVAGPALVSLRLAADRVCRPLALTGLLALGVVGFAAFRILLALKTAREHAEQAGNALAANLLSLPSLSWGWAVLGLGGLLLIVAALVPRD